jgi:hypothetical protein
MGVEPDRITLYFQALDPRVLNPIAINQLIQIISSILRNSFETLFFDGK